MSPPVCRQIDLIVKRHPWDAFVLTSVESYSDLICRFERLQSYHPGKLVFVVEIGKLTGHVNSCVSANQLEYQPPHMSRMPRSHI